MKTRNTILNLQYTLMSLESSGVSTAQWKLKYQKCDLRQKLTKYVIIDTKIFVFQI